MRPPDPPTASLSSGPDQLPGQAKNRRTMAMFLLLAAGSLTWNFGFSVYRGVWSNFLYEVHGILPNQLGVIESVREIPGLAVVLLVALVAGLAPSVVSGFACLFMGFGMLLYPFVHGLPLLIAVTVLFSTGFHMLYPPQNTLVLYHATPGEKGKWLGWMDAVGSGASLLAMILVVTLVSRLGFSGMFFIAAGAAGAAAVILFSTPGPRHLTKRTRLLNIRKEYASYYVMTLLQGARRHFFLVFALYNLVIHGVPASTIALMQGISYAASMVTRPALGRLADRYGEVTVQRWCYVLTGLVFAGYAFIESLPILYVLYTLDSILNFELIITLYAYSVAKDSEVASALSGGSTIGHITGVLVPAAGGFIWKYLGHTATFLTGTTICSVGFVYALWLGRAIARRKAAERAAGQAVAG